MNLPDVKIKTKGWLQGDMGIWVVLILLCVISILEVYSASSTASYKTGNFFKPIMDHGLYVGMGLAFAWLAHFMPCKYFKLLCTCGIFVAIALLIYAKFKGEEVNGAGRWISFGGRTIQPSEIAKIATIGFTALILTMRDKMTGGAHKVGVRIILVTAFIMCLLIGTENFSTAGLLFAVIYIMMWIGKAGAKTLWTIFAIGAIGGGSLFVVGKTLPIETAQSIAQRYDALHRLPTWVNRLQKEHELPANPKDYNVMDNYQVAHSQMAIASCNVIGKGPGKSTERDYLPQAYSDFIYAIIIEEGGLLSAILVMGLYLFLLYRCWDIAKKCVMPFPAYLVMGISFMLVLQAFVNMSVAVGLFPVTGQPLPLISKGGTSTIITCINIGMILSVSRSAKQTQTAMEVQGVSEVSSDEIVENWQKEDATEA